MKRKSKIKLLVSEIAAFGTAVVPLALWFFEDYSVETIVALYVLETILGMILAVLLVLILVPAEKAAIPGKPNPKNKTIKDFLLICGGSALIISIFPAAFIFILPISKGVSFEDVKFGLQIVVWFQLFEFLSNLYLLRPMSLREGETFLSYSFGGMALMLISMLLGIVPAALFNVSPFLPFIVLKTVADFGQPIQYFLGQTPSQTEALFDEASLTTRIKY